MIYVAAKTRYKSISTNDIEPFINIYNEGAINTNLAAGMTPVGLAQTSNPSTGTSLTISNSIQDKAESEASFSLTSALDLTNFTTLKVDWELSGYNATPNAFLIVGNDSSSGEGSYLLRTSETSSFSRKISTLDISSINAARYVRVHG